MKTPTKNIAPTIIKLDKLRAEYQARLDRGVNMTELGLEHNLSAHVMKKILVDMNFTLPGRSKKPSPLLSDLLAVLKRICTELNINHDELKPYL